MQMLFPVTDQGGIKKVYTRIHSSLNKDDLILFLKRMQNKILQIFL